MIISGVEVGSSFTTSVRLTEVLSTIQESHTFVLNNIRDCSPKQPDG